MRLLARGQQMLNRALGVAGAVAITYTRGAEAVTITEADEGAWVGRTVFSSNQQGAARVEFGDRDYLILVARLAALGEPQVGDRITEVVNGVEMVFQVMKPNTGEPAWRYSDPGRTTCRIHTKRVGG